MLVYWQKIVDIFYPHNTFASIHMDKKYPYPIALDTFDIGTISAFPMTQG